MNDRLYTILETDFDTEGGLTGNTANSQKKRSHRGFGVTFVDGAPGAGKTFHTIRYVSGKKVIFLVTRTAPSVEANTLYKEYARILGGYERWTLNQSEPPEILSEKSSDDEGKISIGYLVHRLKERVKKITDVSRVKMLVGISQAGFETHFDHVVDIVDLLVGSGILPKDIVFVFDDVVPDALFGVSRKEEFDLKDYVRTQAKAARLDLSRGYVSQHTLNRIRYKSACEDPELEKRIVYKEEGEYNTLYTSITAHAVALWRKFHVRSYIVRANYLYEQGYTTDILHIDHETPIGFRYVRANRNPKRVINIIRVGEFPSGKVVGKKILKSYLDVIDSIFKDELDVDPEDDSILYIVNRNMLEIDDRLNPDRRRVIVYGTDGINSHAKCTNLVMIGGVYSSPRDESTRTKLNGFDATTLLNIMQTIFRSSLRVDHATEPVNIFVPGKGSLASAVYEALILGGYSRDQIHVHIHGVEPEKIGKTYEFVTNITSFHHEPIDEEPEIRVTRKVKNWPDKSLHEKPFFEPQHAVLGTIYETADVEKKDLVGMKINNHGHAHCIVLDIDSTSLTPDEMREIVDSLPFRASVHNSPSFRRDGRGEERKYHLMIPTRHRIDVRDTKAAIYGVIVEILLRNPDLEIHVKDGKEIVHVSPKNKKNNMNYTGRTIKVDSWPMAKKRLVRKKTKYMLVDTNGMDASNKLLHIPSDIWFMHLNWKDPVSGNLLETRRVDSEERKEIKSKIEHLKNWIERLKKELRASRAIKSPTLTTAKEYPRIALEFPEVYDCTLSPSQLLETMNSEDMREHLEIVPFDEDDYRYLPKIDRDFISDMYTEEFPERHSLPYVLDFGIYKCYDLNKEYPSSSGEVPEHVKELFDRIEDEELRRAAYESPILRHVCNCRDCKKEHEDQLGWLVRDCMLYLRKLEKILANMKMPPVPTVTMTDSKKPYVSVPILLAKSAIATTYVTKIPKETTATKGLPTTNPPPTGKSENDTRREIDWEILRKALSKDGVFTNLIKSGILSRALAEDRRKTIQLVQDASPPAKVRDRLRRLKTLKPYG